MDKAGLIKLINDQWPKYLPAGFTLVVTLNDAHIYQHNEEGYEGDITNGYWSLKDEVTSLQKSREELRHQIKKLEKERAEVDKAIKVLRGNQ